MNKNLLLTVLLLLTGTLTIAQPAPKIETGPKTYVKAIAMMAKILGESNNEFLALRKPVSNRPQPDGSWFDLSKAPNIDRYDKNFALIASNQIMVPDIVTKKSILEFHDVVNLKGQLLVFMSSFEKQSDVNTFFAYKVNPDGSLASETTVLGKFENVSKKNRGDFKFIVSDDTSKVLVIKRSPEVENEREKLEITLLNNNLETIYSSPVPLPYPDKTVTAIKYLAGDNGNTYLLLAADRPKNEITETTQAFFFFVMAYSVTDKKWKEYELKLAGKFISDADLIIDNKSNDLVLSGLYANTFNLNASGVFLMRIDVDTKKILSSVTKEFSQELVDNYKPAKKSRQTEQGIPNLVLKFLKTMPDGGVVLAAQQEWIEEVTVTNHSGYREPGMAQWVNYTKGHIMVVKFSADDKVNWIKSVPKNQKLQNAFDYYSSFALYTGADNSINLVYNDNPDNGINTDFKSVASLEDLNKSETVLVKINKEGEISRKHLFDAIKGEPYFNATIYQPLNNGLIFYKQKGMASQFGKLTW